MSGQRSAVARGSLHAELSPGGGFGFWGGGDQLRGGTMFVATLYFALPLLGKSRLLLAFSSRVFHRGSLAAATPELRAGAVSVGRRSFARG